MPTHEVYGPDGLTSATDDRVLAEEAELIVELIERHRALVTSRDVTNGPQVAADFAALAAQVEAAASLADLDALDWGGSMHAKAAAHGLTPSGRRLTADGDVKGGPVDADKKAKKPKT